MSNILRVPTLGVDAAFEDLVRRTFDPHAASWMPPVDISQSGEDVLIDMELAGVDESSLDIELKEQALRVSGRRNAPSQDEVRSVVRAEIRRGEFSRTFRVPAHLTADAITATYRNGILRIALCGARPSPVSQKISISGISSS